MMVGRTKPPDAEEKRRLETLKEHCPCLLCLLSKGRVRLPDVQHIISGFKRLGHKATYSSCEWHHRGIIPGSLSSKQQAMGVLGPSLAQGKRTFTEEYGSEELLLAVQNYLIDAYDRWKWMDYDIPFEVRRQAIKMWVYGKDYS